MRIAACLVCLLLLAGCSEPRFDGSSKEAVEASLKSLSAGMTEDQKREFDLAVGLAIIDDVATSTPFAAIDGLTAEEILAKGALKKKALHAMTEEQD